MGNVEVAVVDVATMLFTRTRALQADWRGWRMLEVKSHWTGTAKAVEGRRASAISIESTVFFIV